VLLCLSVLAACATRAGLVLGARSPSVIRNARIGALALRASASVLLVSLVRIVSKVLFAMLLVVTTVLVRHIMKVPVTLSRSLVSARTAGPALSVNRSSARKRWR
jgi:hypothetical protein